MKEQIQKAINARDVLPKDYETYRKKLEGVAEDVQYFVSKNIVERLDNLFFPEEINQVEARKFIEYLKTIEFFS